MAQIKKILCTVDFSEYSPQIADYALTLTNALQSELHVLYVTPILAQDMDFTVSPSYLEELNKDVTTEAQKSMQEFIAENMNQVQANGHVMQGHAAETILDFASQKAIDLIVMGTHGRKGLNRVLFGSVADRVVKSANIPVLTLRPQT